jgi:hypothetical protein
LAKEIQQKKDLQELFLDADELIDLDQEPTSNQQDNDSIHILPSDPSEDSEPVLPSTSRQSDSAQASDYFAEYDEYLMRENQQLLREKQNYQRLSNTIEHSVIEEAKVTEREPFFTDNSF